MTAGFALGVLIALTPAMALAHGGHPEAGSLHGLVHLVWLVLPAALFGVGLWRWLKETRV